MVTSSSAAFITHNASSRREPRHVAVGYFDAETWYFTSHDDIVTPDSTKTYYGVIKNMPVESQAIDPVFFKYTMGVGAIEFVDLDDGVTNFLATKFAADVTARKKKIEFYTGFRGMEFADFDLIATQNIDDDIAVNDDDYTVQTADLQRTLRSKIFPEVKTTLSGNVTSTQTYIHVSDPSSFETLKHDANFSHLPNTTVGYIKIKSGDVVEKISWLNKLSAAVTDTGTDISFSSADNSINATTTDLSVFAVGQGITVSGSASNNSTFTIATVTSTKITVSETITTESAGASVTLLADTQFYNCTRGVLNSKAIEHTVDLTASVDRRTAVTQWVYIETTALKIAWGILAGVNYGTAEAWPDGWNLGISTSLLESSQFIAHPDLWDTSDDSGHKLRFEGEREQDAQKFLYEQVFFPVGCFERVLNTGKLGVKRFNRVISGAAAVGQITQADVKGKATLRYALKDVVNLFKIAWNWDPDQQKYTRTSPVLDLNSTAKYDVGDTKITYGLRGLHGSIHTAPTVFGIADMIRDRYSSYPKRLTITCHPGHSRYEPGDIIRVTLDKVKDHTNSNTKRLDSAFEVQKKEYNPHTGEATYTLFGSSEAATPMSHYTGDVLSDAYYSSEGTDISTVLTGTSSGGTFTVTANGTLTGNADVTNVNAIYYCTENLAIQAGVDITYTLNIQLRVKGQLTINGKLVGKGQGITGVSGTVQEDRGDGVRYYRDVAGTPGFIGASQSGGGFVQDLIFSDVHSVQSKLTQGTYDTAPYLPLVNTGQFSVTGTDISFAASDDSINATSTDLSIFKAGRKITITGSTSNNGTYTVSSVTSTKVIVSSALTDESAGASITATQPTMLTGIPTDLRGTSGGSGGPVSGRPYTGNDAALLAAGGAGGNGGAGLFVVARGMVFGSNGQIDCSGNAGSTGSHDSTNNLYAGSGAPGHPGAVYVIIDNAASNYPDNNVVADLVQPQTQGTVWEFDQYGGATNGPRPGYSGYTGTPDTDAKLSVFRVQYAPKSETTEQDVSQYTSPPTAVAKTNGTATQNDPNTITVFMGATAPSDGNYQTANIYIQESGRTGFELIGQSAGTTDLVPAKALKPNTTYNIRAYGVSLDGIESPDYLSTTHTTPAITSTVSRLVELAAADAYDNNAIFYHTYFDSLDGFLSVGAALASGYVEIGSTSATSVEYVRRSMVYPLGSTNYTWSNNRRFKIKVRFDLDIYAEAYVISGNYSGGYVNGFGFVVRNDTLLFVAGNGSAQTETSAMYSPTYPEEMTLEAVFTAGSKVEFYVNGTYQSSYDVTSNLPTGTTDSSSVFHAIVNGQTGWTTYKNIRFNEFKMLQE